MRFYGPEGIVGNPSAYVWLHNYGVERAWGTIPFDNLNLLTKVQTMCPEMGSPSPAIHLKWCSARLVLGGGRTRAEHGIDSARVRS
jgi:hypothetical protein